VIDAAAEIGQNATNTTNSAERASSRPICKNMPMIPNTATINCRPDAANATDTPDDNAVMCASGSFSVDAMMIHVENLSPPANNNNTNGIPNVVTKISRSIPTAACSAGSDLRRIANWPAANRSDATATAATTHDNDPDRNVFAAVPDVSNDGNGTHDVTNNCIISVCACTMLDAIPDNASLAAELTASAA